MRSQSESSDEVTELDLSHGKKDAFVLEVLLHWTNFDFLRVLEDIYFYNQILICSIATVLYIYKKLNMAFIIKLKVSELVSVFFV